MKRWETLVALVAVIAASLGALPFAGHAYCTAVGVVMIAVVGGARLWDSLQRKRTQPTDAAQRAARIREQRRRR